MKTIRVPSHLEFVYPDFFERSRDGVLTDADMEVVEGELLEDAERGVTLGGTAGVRKVRAAQQGRGKSGSARVAYLYVAKWATVFFLFAFPKNVQENLTDAQKKAVRQKVAQIVAEEWPRKKPKK